MSRLAVPVRGHGGSSAGVHGASGVAIAVYGRGGVWQRLPRTRRRPDVQDQHGPFRMSLKA